MKFYPVEPLVFSPISSKEEAKKILKDNSYYIFVAAFMSWAVFLLSILFEHESQHKHYLIYGIYYFVLAIAIRKQKSRTASIVALITFGLVIIGRVLENDIGSVFGFSLIFLHASYRSVKASFFYKRSCQRSEVATNSSQQSPEKSAERDRYLRKLESELKEFN
jgi:hypothetical protein